MELKSIFKNLTNRKPKHTGEEHDIFLTWSRGRALSEHGPRAPKWFLILIRYHLLNVDLSETYIGYFLQCKITQFEKGRNYEVS